MKLIKVSTPAHQKAFIEIVVRLNCNEKKWIKPLELDSEELFHKETNKLNAPAIHPKN
jgi:hypothetical protein